MNKSSLKNKFCYKIAFENKIKFFLNVEVYFFSVQPFLCLHSFDLANRNRSIIVLILLGQINNNRFFLFQVYIVYKIRFILFM